METERQCVLKNTPLRFSTIPDARHPSNPYTHGFLFLYRNPYIYILEIS